MTEPAGAVPPLLAVGYASAGFAALGVFGVGFTSLLTDTEVLAAEGLGNIPGIVAMLAAAVAFVVGEWIAVRRRTYPPAGLVAVAVVLAYVAGVIVGGVLAEVDPARAVAAAGLFATSWYALVLAGAAFIAAWAGIALVRTRARRPQWPWEKHPDDE